MLSVCADTVADSLSGVARGKELLALIIEQIYVLGSQSIALITAAGLAIGAVMALQFGNGLHRFGGTMYVPELVGISVFRELGPVSTGLLLAGRIGSGITSELASMNVTEQIDAVRALGDSPYASLVLPRIVACLIAFPILTLYGDLMSSVSAMGISYSELGIGPSFFLSKISQTLDLRDLFTGVSKTVVFALFISIAACWRGLNTRGGTRAVGNSTTWIVVVSSIFILISDFFMSKFFILTVFKNG
jgi:phospholipid/cholesterol/gamma-HCH transport system permease protein